NYVYNEIATEMIKQELLDGHAVSIAYHADQAMDPDARMIIFKDILVKMGVDESDADKFFQIEKGEIDESSLTEKELFEVMKIRLFGYTYMPFEEMKFDTLEEITAAVEEAKAAAEAAAAKEASDTDDTAARAAAERIGVDYDKAMEILTEQSEASKGNYMKTENYAQYCYDENAGVNHGVVIVGYDDNFPASDFLEGNQPPADGAWIVRNSWGPLYGNDGYFYLSYYDRTITTPESFEYAVEEASRQKTTMLINEYDFMPTASVSGWSSKTPVYMANEFTLDMDAVLTCVSCMTATFNTNVTAAVYLLNENAKNPTDGELLDVCTVDFKYAGYHRIPLNQNYSLPAGSRISVVQTQRYDDTDGRYYVMPYAIELNSNFSEEYNEMAETLPDLPAMQYGIEGKIGKGESFVCTDDTWTDWADLTEEVKEGFSRAKDYASFDNFAIKAYYNMLSDIEEEHTFGESVPYAGGSIRLCTDCGYSLAER
ncbi:MAG: hypothetical protein HUJ73_01395, partial [Eubacterium sp.]|nr:hypothetical protein [Eubacterium sp.]